MRARPAGRPAAAPSNSGWKVGARRALTYPVRLGPYGENWLSTRFGVLAVINNLSTVGDALIAVALAGSVFVSVPLHAARGRTALGLACTMLPFAVVAPLTGPMTDRLRRGKGLVVTLAAVARLVAVVLMAPWIHSLLLFPAAFLALVAGKTHSVARAALVTAVADEDQLVAANSKMAIGGGVASGVAAALAGVVYWAFGSKAILRVDIFVFSALIVLSFSLSGWRSERAAKQGESGRRVAPPLRRAALAIGAIRAMAGFLTALVVFGLRAQGAPTAWYALVGAAGIAGNLSGAATAPAARAWVRSERRIVTASCILIGLAAVAATQFPYAHHRVAAALLAFLAGLFGSVAKAAFDAMVQSRVPESSQAGTFAIFEGTFQIVWVLSALIPTLIDTSLPVGFAVMAGVLLGLGALTTIRDGRGRYPAHRPV